MSTTQELNHWMRFKKNYVGTFPRDEIPIFSNSFDGCLIVNTHSSNLHGEHWIGIICRNGQVYYFDPIGWIPCNSILQQFCQFEKINVNSTRFQSLNSTLCGHHVVFYLYNFYPAINDMYAKRFINNIE